MELKVCELTESIEKMKEKIQSMEVELTDENIRNMKAIEQLTSSNRLLQAELECQREYVEKFRSASCSDLVEKLKVGIETITSQEILRSVIGTEQAILSCQESWKRRIEEIQIEHEKHLVKLLEKHQNDIRYTRSQFQIQMEQSRVEIEDRVQKRCADSLKAAIAHKESQRQLDIKNEIKRWEQVSCSKIHFMSFFMLLINKSTDDGRDESKITC
jgi:hypothetical protein